MIFIPDQPGIQRTIILPFPPDINHRRITRENILVEMQGLAEDLLKLYAFLRDQREYHDGAYDELAKRLNELPTAVGLGFFQDNAAANQTDVALSNGMSIRGYPAPLAGSIVGIAVKSNDARTAGSLTVKPTINAVAGSITAVLDGDNMTATFTQQDGGTDVFAAGDNLGATIITTAAWLPVTADVDVVVGVIYSGRFT